MRTHLDIKHEGTLDGERKRMTFDPNSIAHLMSVLTDLYSDVEMAVIREYSTNALDSHRRAGVDKPIQVTSPSDLHRYFTVTDFGEGMTAQQLTDEFGSYGWSSNRDTDATTGMLGLGCKSGLAYAFQFTVTTCKDGVQTLALVTREEDGAGAIEIIAQEETGQPNGTTIEIPVKDPFTFERKMKNFFRFWDPGDVLMDGEAPECLWDVPWPDGINWMTVSRASQGVAFKLDEDIVVSPHVNGLAIVMGGVAYPVSTATMDNQKVTLLARLLEIWHSGMAVRVPIGSVDFTPSREQLTYSKRTREVVASIQEYVVGQIQRALQEAIDAQPTHRDAYNLWCELRRRNILGDRGVSAIRKYRSEVIPQGADFRHEAELAFDSKTGEPILEYVTEPLGLVKWSGRANTYGPPPPTHKQNHYGVMRFMPDWWSTDLNRWSSGSVEGNNKRFLVSTHVSISDLSSVGLIITNCRLTVLTQADKRKVRQYCLEHGMLASDITSHAIRPIKNNSLVPNDTRTNYYGNRAWDFILAIPGDTLPKADWWLTPDTPVVSMDEIRQLEVFVPYKPVVDKPVAGVVVEKPKAGTLRAAGKIVGTHTATSVTIPDDGSAQITAYVDTTKHPYNSNQKLAIEMFLVNVGFTPGADKYCYTPMDLSFVFVNAREKTRFLRYYPDVPDFDDWLKETYADWMNRRPRAELLQQARGLRFADQDSKYVSAARSGSKRSTHDLITPYGYDAGCNELIRGLGASNVDLIQFMDPDLRRAGTTLRSFRSDWRDLPDNYFGAHASQWVSKLSTLAQGTQVPVKHGFSDWASVPAELQEFVLLLEELTARYFFVVSNNGFTTIAAGRDRNTLLADKKNLEAQSAVEMVNAVYITREGLHLIPVS